MRSRIIGLLSLLLPVLTAHGFTVSGNVSGRSGLALSFVLSIPTTVDTFYLAVVNLFNGNYSQELPQGSYTLMAFQDIDFNLLPSPGDPRGFYGGEFPQILVVDSDLEDIDIALLPPNTGGFSGTVSYDGEATGATSVLAHRSNSFTGLPSGIGLLLTNNGNGDYTAIVDSFGIYYAYAFMDVNGNLQYDLGEPWDVYGDDLEPEPINIVQGQSFPDDIHFELVAISSAHSPVQVVEAFKLGTPYPNPFNAATTIPFLLDKPLEIEMVAYDILGRTVATLASGSYGAGEHIVKFGNASMASGLYLIELRAQNVSLYTPVVLQK